VTRRISWGTARTCVVHPPLFIRKATTPGLEPGPSTDGISPNGQGGRSFDAGTTRPCFFPFVDSTASPYCRYGAGRRADYLPACKGSVDLWLPGHAIARNWRQTALACHSHVYEGGTYPREAARCARAFPAIGIPALQPDAKFNNMGYASPCIRENCVAYSFRDFRLSGSGHVPALNTPQAEPGFRLITFPHP
jgi:hypothetical protein